MRAPPERFCKVAIHQLAGNRPQIASSMPGRGQRRLEAGGRWPYRTIESLIPGKRTSHLAEPPRPLLQHPASGCSVRISVLRQATGALDVKKTSGTKYSIVIAGKKTSVSLETEFWDALDEIIEASATTRSSFIRKVASAPGATNLASRIRIKILRNFRRRHEPRRR